MEVLKAQGFNLDQQIRRKVTLELATMAAVIVDQIETLAINRLKRNCLVRNTPKCSTS